MPSFIDTIQNIPRFLEVFKEGKELSNAATWKNRTVTANILVALLGTLITVAKTYGYNFNLDDQTVAGLATGIVSFVTAINAIMHVITSARVGVSSNGGNSPPAESASDSGDTGAGGN